MATWPALTWSTGQLVTSAQLNGVRDQLNELHVSSPQFLDPADNGKKIQTGVNSITGVTTALTSLYLVLGSISVSMLTCATVPRVIATSNGDLGGQSMAPYYAGVTTTGFTANCLRFTSGTNGGIQWLAIG